MSWSDFYLIAFLIGFLLTVISFLAGSVHLHLPHVHFHHGMHAGHGHSGFAWFNFGTIAAFLAWFGGTGYLLSHYYRVWMVVVLGVATMSGIGGAAIVFWFLAKVLIADERPLDAADYEMTGMLGRLSIPIREGGTGELIYSQAGTRRVTGAKSDDGIAIPKGAEVMVTRYEKGIAYVRPWEDPLADPELRNI
jgi:membrane protein implicated in regulation of membrane protease activity